MYAGYEEIEKYWQGREVEVIQLKKGQKVHALQPGKHQTFCLPLRQKDIIKPYYSGFAEALGEKITCQSCQEAIKDEARKHLDKIFMEDIRKRRFVFEVLFESKELVAWFLEYSIENGGYDTVINELIKKLKAEKENE